MYVRNTNQRPYNRYAVYELRDVTDPVDFWRAESIRYQGRYRMDGTESRGEVCSIRCLGIFHLSLSSAEPAKSGSVITMRTNSHAVGFHNRLVDQINSFEYACAC